MSTLDRTQPAAPIVARTEPTTGREHNPNRGKRHLAAHVRTPRTTAPRGKLRSAVTILHVDPASLRRARRPGQNLSDATLDRATVVARGVTRQSDLRAAAQLCKESVKTA